MTPEAIAVRKLVEEIQDLESEIESLEGQKMRAEYRLDQMMRVQKAAPRPAADTLEMPRRGRSASDESAKARIKRLLDSEPNDDFDAETVCRRLDIKLGTIRTNLSKMVGGKLRMIEKRSTNTYGSIRQPKAEEAIPEEIAS